MENSFCATIGYSQSISNHTFFKQSGFSCNAFEGNQNNYYHWLKRYMKNNLFDSKVSKILIELSYSLSDSSLGEFSNNQIISETKKIILKRLGFKRKPKKLNFLIIKY